VSNTYILSAACRACSQTISITVSEIAWLKSCAMLYKFKFKHKCSVTRLLYLIWWLGKAHSFCIVSTWSSHWCIKLLTQVMASYLNQRAVAGDFSWKSRGEIHIYNSEGNQLCNGLVKNMVNSPSLGVLLSMSDVFLKETIYFNNTLLAYMHK